jgi:peptide chain release factor 1
MSLAPLIEDLERNYREAQERMSAPGVYNDHREAAAAGRRLKELEEPYKLAQEWKVIQADLGAAAEDTDLQELVPALEGRVLEIEEELKVALAERDPNDDKDVIVEVRSGVGGDEGALWAADVYKMLKGYAERRGFRVEDLGSNPNDGGGLKEVSFAVKGDGAYSIFKFEGGTHRVQRVPQTESQGRIHTSTATVAVMPEAEEVEIEVHDKDLRVDTMRASGPGGQHMQKNDTAVRITHLPTGMAAYCQDGRSQLQNRESALRILRARLYEVELERQRAASAAERQSQVGSGGRSEKIRTYNYAESRVTDHRIKLTVHQLEKVLLGDLDELTAGLQVEEQGRRLAV